MKNFIISSILCILAMASNAYAETPTKSLTKIVNALISVASNAEYDEQTKKVELTKVIASSVDFEKVSKSIVTKKWKKATAEQKQQFKDNFLGIMVNTYFALLKDYDNEKVTFGLCNSLTQPSSKC